MKILMVCLGNICRSPMAEGIMRDKIKEYELDAQVDSCGTADYHVGESPDHRAQNTLKQHESDISMLRGRQFQESDFDSFDLIFTMDDSNYRNIMALARNEHEEKKVEMIMNMAYPKENIPVPDPYYGGINGFEEVYQMLTLACDKIAVGIKN